MIGYSCLVAFVFLRFGGFWFAQFRMHLFFLLHFSFIILGLCLLHFLKRISSVKLSWTYLKIFYKNIAESFTYIYIYIYISFTYRTHLTFSDKGWTVEPDNMSNWPQNQAAKIRFSCFSFKLIKHLIQLRKENANNEILLEMQ